ncbi:MAG: GGDEF domain-containing protein [Burkholderiaceae bacterium]
MSSIPSNPASTPASTHAPTAADLARAALRRLALEQIEPTPENFAHAYEQESGTARPKGSRPGSLPEADDAAPQLATLIERVVRGVERGSRAWTTARKKDALQRVLQGSRSDAQRLKQRLNQLLTSWETETHSAAVDLDEAPGLAAVAEPGAARRVAPPATELPMAAPALPATDTAAVQHRQYLVDQLGRLCRELSAGMVELAESGSWVKGQCQAMQDVLAGTITARAVKAVNELLRTTRKHQGALHTERKQARDALKELVSSMLAGLGELGSQTGRFRENAGRYTEAIEQAQTLESLTSVVRDMVVETRTVHAQVAQTHARLNEEHARASGLSERVHQLEDELRRLSDEVTTDQLTQVANRRGLLKVFEVERARMERSASPLAVGLLDIDNFKRLNDELGHSAGDEALKALAALVSKTLRPTDAVARYGGEEFVVLLPETSLAQAEFVLTRLQRTLSSGLFLHEDKDVFVTFSAGVAQCGRGERIEDVLERADRALYEAKRAGKNRTCIG